MTFTLTVENRTEQGKKLETLRKSGKLPGVMYGPKEAATPLTVDKTAFEKLLKQAGESSVITLEGLSSGKKEVLIHDVAFDVTRGGAIHVDFYAIEAGKEITVDVPLEFIGEAPAVKQGGTLTKVLHEIEVTCVPKDLPQHISVDVSVLDAFDKQIHVRDLVVPKGVVVENDPEDVVVLVQAVEEETEPAPTIDMNAIEVEKKGKVDSEEEA